MLPCHKFLAQSSVPLAPPSGLVNCLPWFKEPLHLLAATRPVRQGFGLSNGRHGHYSIIQMAFWNSSTPLVANTILSAQVDVICSMLDRMYVECPRIEPSLQLPHGVNYACSSSVFS